MEKDAKAFYERKAILLEKLTNLTQELAALEDSAADPDEEFLAECDRVYDWADGQIDAVLPMVEMAS